MKCSDCVFYTESYHPRVDLTGYNCGCRKTSLTWYRRKHEEIRDACDYMAQVNDHDMECLVVEENPDMKTKTTHWSFNGLKEMNEWMNRQED